jgi:hypothetical protein
MNIDFDVLSDSGHDSTEDARAALDVAKRRAWQFWEDFKAGCMWSAMEIQLRKGPYGKLFRRTKEE